MGMFGDEGQDTFTQQRIQQEEVERQQNISRVGKMRLDVINAVGRGRQYSNPNKPSNTGMGQ